MRWVKKGTTSEKPFPQAICYDFQHTGTTLAVLCIWLLAASLGHTASFCARFAFGFSGSSTPFTPSSPSCLILPFCCWILGRERKEAKVVRSVEIRLAIENKWYSTRKHSKASRMDTQQGYNGNSFSLRRPPTARIGPDVEGNWKSKLLYFERRPPSFVAIWTSMRWCTQLLPR